MKNIINIAIDGPSGSGKSTLAKALAKHYGLIYVDTGALYRAVGLYIMRLGIASDDSAAIIAALPDIDLTMKLIDGSGVVLLDGKPVGDEIRTAEVAMYASEVSALPAVRAFLLSTQRDIAKNHGAIMDGRDIGTVILPNAQVKIFLTAGDEKRAYRRYLELNAKQPTSYEAVLADIRRRDANDSGRALAPAVPAKDAFLLDNSDLNAEETFIVARAVIDEVLYI